MKFKRPIYRYLFYAGWLAVLGGLTTLVIAANGKTGKRTCKGVVVSVNGEGEHIVVEKDDVLKTVERSAKGPLQKKHIADINLGGLERTLEKNAWIRDAELYFDTRDVLHVVVWERQPVARIFTPSGSSFYMDSSGYQLPLVAGFSARLPVVTGYAGTKTGSRKDSLTLQGLKELLSLVQRDEFWKAQVGQIDVTAERKFELIPLVGSHVVKLGYAENLEQKLHNLLVFYKQVMPRAGLAKYSALDLQFDGQVVAVRKGTVSVVDSLQLQKNIEELMKKKAAEQEPEDMAIISPAAAPQTARIDDSTLIDSSQPTAGEKETPPIPEKPSIQSRNVAKPTEKPPVRNATSSQKPPVQPAKKPASKPKAVMPAKAQNEY